MRQRELLERITFDPGIFGGKPILRGHRLSAPVATSEGREDFERYLAAVPPGEPMETDRLPE